MSVDPGQIAGTPYTLVPGQLGLQTLYLTSAPLFLIVSNPSSSYCYNKELDWWVDPFTKGAVRRWLVPGSPRVATFRTDQLPVGVLALQPVITEKIRLVFSDDPGLQESAGYSASAGNIGNTISRGNLFAVVVAPGAGIGAKTIPVANSSFLVPADSLYVTSNVGPTQQTVGPHIVDGVAPGSVTLETGLLNAVGPGDILQLVPLVGFAFNSNQVDLTDRAPRLVGHVSVDNALDLTDRALRLLGVVTIASPGICKVHEPGANVAATITFAAGSGSQRWTLHSAFASMINNGGPTSNSRLQVIDGATTIWTAFMAISATLGDSKYVPVPQGLQSSLGSALTIAFAGAPGAFNFESLAAAATLA